MIKETVAAFYAVRQSPFLLEYCMSGFSVEKNKHLFSQGVYNFIYLADSFAKAEEYRKMSSFDHCDCDAPCTPTMVSCPTPAEAIVSRWKEKLEKKKDTSPMQYEKNNIRVDLIANAPAVVSDLAKTREHLLSRLYDVRDEKRNDLRLAFNMDPVYPKTRGELVEWLKAGKFTVDPKKLDRPFNSYDPLRSITLGDAVKDEVGYDAAKKQLDAARATTEDTIKALDEKAGLEALRDFQAETFPQA